MPIIDTPAGTLEVTNAILSASEFRATQKISVSNSAPTKNFSVGDKFHVSTTDADAVNITGNLVAHTLKIGNLLVSPTFDLAAVSNVGNTTSNTLQFANATTGFVTSSNVEIGGNITLTSNAQVKVGSNVLAEYTGPHGREPTTPLLKKYPEIAFHASKLDGNDTTNTYTQAGYTVTASSDQSQYNLHAWRIFDGNTTSPGNGWASQDGTYYDGTSPVNSYTGTTHQLGTGTDYGEWLKVELPYKIKVSRFTLYADPGSGYGTNEAPKSYKIYGSELGSSWTELKAVSSEVPSIYGNSHDITDTTAYKYLAIVVTQVNTDQDNIRIGELEFYGYEEPAPPGDLSLDTTLKSTFNSVRSNNYVMYFDGDGFDPNDTNSNNLVTGSSVSVIHHNATYDSTGKYWTLDGSTESNVTTGSLGFEGDVPHTVSMWVNSSNLDANALTQQLFSIGSGYDKAFLKVDDTQIAANTWHNVTYAYQGEGGSKVTYVDGRKVEEAQVEDTFGDYPPFAMTDYETGGYRVSASTEYDDGAGSLQLLSWMAFDNTTATRWDTANDANYDVNGVHNNSVTTIVDGTSRSGEWIQVEFPHKLRLSYFTLNTNIGASPINYQQRAPKTVLLAGSNNGTDWVSLFNNTSNPRASEPSTTLIEAFALSTTQSYKYFRLIALTTFGGQGLSVSISELKYYGHKEGDLTRFPEPTRVLKYPHVTMTGPGQRGYVVEASSQYGDYHPYHAFNEKITLSGNEPSDHVWTSNTADYPSSGGTYTSTTYGIGTTYGEFLKLTLPYKVKPTKARIFPRTYSGGIGNTQAPAQFKIFGSNDNFATFTELYDQNTDWVNGGTWGEFTISTTNYFKHFGIVFTKTNGTNIVGIQALEYYGTQEDTGTPTIMGGPFAGKVANFRVYDQYLGDERIQEIYDAQKDAFGHKKSSVTFYKGRIGVGTTEPEGALTVIDEPHALAKFPVRAVSADDSYVEGDGQIKLSAADGSGYQAFDGLTSTSWTATPTRNTRLSEEVDFGAWLKIQTPESVSLKKVEIESNPYWRQVGSTIVGGAVSGLLGIACDCSRDGTRIIMGAYGADVGGTDTGSVRVYDWNGSAWSQVGNIISGTENDAYAGYDVSISGDGNIIAVAETYHDGGGASGDNRGVVSVWYLNGATWTILPDSGALTSVAPGLNDKFVGSSAGELLGFRIKLSGDGYTLAVSHGGYSTNAGRVSVYRYVNGAWTQRGQNIDGVENNDLMGYSLDMSEDGNHLIIGAHGGTNINAFVYDYNSGTNSWDKIGGSTLAGTSSSNFGISSAISNDGSVIAVGASGDDADGNDSGRVYMYKRSGSNWTLVSTLSNPSGATDELFGTSVSLSGDGTRLVVGASYYDPPGGGTSSAGHAGKLYTFEYDGASWKLRDLNSISATGLEAGVSNDTGAHLGQYQSMNISRDGSTIIGGEYLADITLANEGRVRVWNMPSNIKSIWGSNDDVNWTKITTGNETFRVSDRLEFKNLDNPNYYKYHAIVADAFTRLKDVKLFGVRKQGSSTLHDGTLTLTKKVTAPQLESTGIINMKGDYTEIRANSNVVTEFSRSKKLIKYPRVALLSGQSGLGSGYTQDGYTVQASSESTLHLASNVFNNIIAAQPVDHAWISANDSYGTNGLATSGNSKDTFETIDGSWVGIKLPVKIKLEYINLHNRYNTSSVTNDPKNGIIWARNEGTNWTRIYDFSNLSDTLAGLSVINVQSQNHYNEFRIQITEIYPNTTNPCVAIQELELYGVPEYDPEAHGTDVVVKSVPNVPNTDWLEVYYDAKNYSGSGDVQDETTNNRDAEMNATFDNGEIKAFSFRGAYTSNVTTSDHGLGTGDVRYTMSYWFKRTAVASTYDYVVMLGNGGTNYSSVLMWINNNQLVLDHWSAALRVLDPIILDKWYHVAAGHSGGNTPSLENDFIYIDGKKVTPQIIQTAGPFTLAGSKLTLGTSHYSTTEFLNGKIANFRLFNRALTSDEVWQLYAYQKEYFGHGDLGMTIKAGRLGIGTSEPRAALDVRGDARFNFAYRELHMYSKPNVYIYNSSGTPLTLPYNASGKYLFFRFPNYYSKNFEPIIASDYRYYVPENGLYFVRFTPFGNGTLTFEWFINKNRNERGNSMDLNYVDGFGPYVYANGVAATTMSAIIPMTTTDYITFGVFTMSTDFDMSTRTSACITLIQRF